MSNPERQAGRFYLALALATAATLMLQIVETRIISVTSWYHLAFFVISLAMFGLTAGAVWVYLRAARFAAAPLADSLSSAALAFAATTVLALFAQLTLVSGTPLSAMSFVAWAEFAVVLAVPFFFSGIVVSLALTRSPYPIGRVYAADLAGAAVGCLGVLALLNAVSGPAAVLLTALLAAGSGLLFAQGPSRGRLLVAAAVAAVALGNLLLPQGARPLVVKGAIENPDKFAYEGWNSFSRITVDHPGQSAPALWGPSVHLPPSTISQAWMTIDGSTGTAVYAFDGDLGKLPFLRYDVSNLAYAVPGLRKGAVIGVGGGRDVLSAKLFGLEEVTGVEINPIFIRMLGENFSSFTSIAKLPGVHFEVDDARSWFARTVEKFDVIQMSLIDTWAATGAGAFTLSENGLYTVEAWRTFLRKLTPAGIFTVSRWHAPGEVNETGRMIALAVASLQQDGAASPRNHIFLATAGQIATLVLSRSPLSEAAVASLEETAARLDFKVLLSPASASASPLLGAIVASASAADLQRATEGYYLDLSPSTDARPFFFNQLRLTSLLDAKVLADPWQQGVFGGNLIATLTLAMLVAISLLLVAATIVVPLAPALRASGARLAWAGSLYFALIGTGFMFAEIGLLQRISVFLGHPVYALSIVLFSLILSTGLGSLLSDRLPLRRAWQLLAWALLTAAYIAALPAWLPDALAALDSAGLLVRASLCVAVLAPAGVLMGFGFPTGMRLVAAIDPRPTPWFWGINGAAGVLAASVAVMCSIAFSIDATLRAGAACYALVPLAGVWLVGARKA